MTITHLLMALVLALLILLQLCWASERKFDVKDDIFAFPQYDVAFTNTYITYDNAYEKLASSSDSQGYGTGDEVQYNYEYMVGNGRPFLCAIPQVGVNLNETDDSVPETEHDLVAAADRGWQLLKEMEGQQCLYYTTGWWSYMFCYNSYVKQYHGIVVSSQGRQWPPAEDPNTPSYILGTRESFSHQQAQAGIEGIPPPKAGDLQTHSETTFLVQKLEGGTPCDLTGKPRKIEVQYHCRPGMQDHIGWIKETATCAYQMVVYTSRLCNDVVFQPPKEAHLHKIECQEIVTEEEYQTLLASPSSNAPPTLVEEGQGQQQRIMVGKIELGGKQLVGNDGKKIERGRIVMTAEEQAEVVVIQKDGQIQSLSAADLKKLDLSPEEVASFQKEMQKLAGGHDWKIERLGDANGQLSLRGVVSTDAKKEEQAQDGDVTGEEGDDTGSEEHFKHEI